MSTPISKADYAGFWARFGGFALDCAILLPWSALRFWLGNKYRLFEFAYFLPDAALAIWYNVYLVKKYGGTPGRLLVKTKMVKANGKPIDYKAAVLRYAVVFILMSLSSIWMMTSLYRMTDAEFSSLNSASRLLVFLRLEPAFFGVLGGLTQIWVFSEFLVILLNKKRQSFEDFIAKTVVIKSP